MPNNGPVDMNETIKAWADIVLNVWQAKLTTLRIYDTGELYNSLKHELTYNANGNIDKVEFSFKLYGIFRDMGAGRGRERMISKDKEWFSRKYYGQIMRLKEILVEKYGQEIAFSLGNTISSPLNT
jgi:hypothetical protein